MTLGDDLAIRLLGVPTAQPSASGRAFPAKGFQLLALILCSPSQMIRRREAASLLWNCSSEAEAFANLRQLLARIRRHAVPAGALIASDAQRLSLGEGAGSIDLYAFTRLAEAEAVGDVVRGLSVFRGDLLQAVTESTDEFLHWLTRERSALRERFFAVASSALIDLTRYGRASSGDLRGIANRMLALEPERETSYRVLIEAFGRNGDFAEAERLYGDLGAMLRKEYGAVPTPETDAVARRVFTAGRERLNQSAPEREISRPRVAFLVPRSQGGRAQDDVLHAFIEDVANELTRYRTFAVLAAHSSFQIDHDSGMPLDNSVLRADYTVSGFVRAEDGDPVLVLRMTRCASGEIVWSGDFPLTDGEFTHAFRRITTRVASSLASELERDAIENRGPGTTTKAYRRYLEGKAAMKQCDLAPLRRARAAFRDAVTADPGFSAPYASMAQTLYLEWLLLGGNDPMLLRRAEHEAQESIRLDPNDALGYWMNGAVALYQRDFGRSAEMFAEAETLNPNSADLLLQHGDALGCIGEADAGWSRFGQALLLNPLPPEHYWWAGASIAFNRSDFEGAIDLCGRLENDEPVLRLLAASHARAGDIATARRYGQRLMETYPGARASEMAKLVPYKDVKNQKSYAEGLQLAGVP